MTINDFNKKLEERKRIIEENIPLGVATADTHAMMVQRIFTDGLNSSDSKIGNYATSPPLYVNTTLNAPIQKAPKGKYGETKFKTGAKKGQLHKTTYFESYKAFRQAESRESSFVNLRLFGNLQNDFSTGLKRVNNDSWVAVVRKDESGDKIKGAESKYGKVFFLTQDERKHFKDLLLFELQQLLK